MKRPNKWPFVCLSSDTRSDALSQARWGNADQLSAKTRQNPRASSPTASSPTASSPTAEEQVRTGGMPATVFIYSPRRLTASSREAIRRAVFVK